MKYARTICHDPVRRTNRRPALCAAAPRRQWRRALAAKIGVGLFLLFSIPACAETPLLELFARFYRIEAEVAADPPTRQTGLMRRRTMPPHRGMLFVFPQAQRHCMWMRNTFIPLSVAFLDETGRIINIENMQPQTETNHCAARDARYALEMNIAWFSARGIQPGTRIDGIEKAPKPY